MNFFPTVTAVLGGTNTGKTHYAVERMLARSSGVIGLPLRLLAREVYARAVREKGETACALITGEEKIVPPHARYMICTTEAMPMAEIRAGKFASVVVDEVQMFTHKERGHVFTDRMLHARGTEETMLLGSNTARGLIEKLVRDARFLSRDRFSTLSYSGHAKLSRLPKRSVIVAFSAGEVYALAELMRRYYGGAALVMGGLSPRTRNAQAALYQSGEVDYMVATDAIGMGLNLDADHVAFASLRKFDGERRRHLTAAETAQIAGRAGRFRNNGTFGTTGSCLPLDDDIVARIENNSFMPDRYAQWRSSALDFTSLEVLKDSLAQAPKLGGLRRTAPATDESVLERLCTVHDIAEHVQNRQDVKRLWDVCQIPDFPDLGLEAHGRLLDDVHTNMRKNGGKLPASYMDRNINRLDETSGTVEMLSARLANIRTWTYIAQKSDWLLSHENWVNRARVVENGLSDALHTKLVDRFIDRRTSVLLKGIGNKINMDVSISSDGLVNADGQAIGALQGLVFTPIKTQGDLEAKAVNAAAAKVLGPEIDRRLTQIMSAGQGAISLSFNGEFLWTGMPVAKLMKGESLLKPKVELIGGALGSAVLQAGAQGRIQDFIRLEINERLGCLFALRDFAEDPKSFKGARALAHVMFEQNGIVSQKQHHKLLRETGPEGRRHIVGVGAQFGYNFAYMRDLMKQAPSRLLSTLNAFAWKDDGKGTVKPFFPSNGASSVPDDPSFTEEVLNIAGYTRLGPRIIRVDIVNSISSMLLMTRKQRPDDRLIIKTQMLAKCGCSYEDFQGILKAMRYYKVSEEMNAEDAAARKTYVLNYFARKQAIQKLREDGVTGKIELPEFAAKPTPASSESASDAEPPKEPPKEPYVPKRQRSRNIVLEDFVVTPKLDDEGNPIIDTHRDVWAFGVDPSKKKSGYLASRRHGTSSKNNDDGGNEGSKNSAPKNRESQSGNPKRANSMWGSKKPNKTAQKGRGRSSSHRGHKSAVSEIQKKTGASPLKVASGDSPFAALAGLKFDAPKKNSKLSKNTKPETPKPETPEPKGKS